MLFVNPIQSRLAVGKLITCSYSWLRKYSLIVLSKASTLSKLSSQTHHLYAVKAQIMDVYVVRLQLCAEVRVSKSLSLHVGEVLKQVRENAERIH